MDLETDDEFYEGSFGGKSYTEETNLYEKVLISPVKTVSKEQNSKHAEFSQKKFFANMKELYEWLMLSNKTYHVDFLAEKIDSNDIDIALKQEDVRIPPGRLIFHRTVIYHDNYVLALLLISNYRELINELDSLERSPLHLALLSCNPIAVQLLLSFREGTKAFCDLSIPFSQIPSIQLPLSGVICEASLESVIYIFRLLLGYSKLAVEIQQNCTALENIEIDSIFYKACNCFSDSKSTENASDVCSESFISSFSEFLGSKGVTPASWWGINAIDAFGRSVLHKASSFGLTKIIQLLLEKGANTQLRDCYEKLAIHYAIESGNELALQALLINMRNSSTSSNEKSAENNTATLAEELPIVSLIKLCIARGAWKCLGKLVMDEVYSQYPISESEFDQLAEYATLCGFHKEFTAAFTMAVDGQMPIGNGVLADGTTTAQTRVKVFIHDDCLNHLPLPKDLHSLATNQLRIFFKYPENPTRLHCLLPNVYGILRHEHFSQIPIQNHSSLASFADILRVHEWSYVQRLIQRTEKVSTDEDTKNVSYPLEEIDLDTPLTPGSWQAACAAAGSVIAAVSAVCSGEIRSAFCAIRPPGHHVGTWGPCQYPHSPSLVGNTWRGQTSMNSQHYHQDQGDWVQGSQGFCLLNNVAIGAAYARYHFYNSGIRRIAIVDFDIHHGNGTQQIILNLAPRSREIIFSNKDRPNDFVIDLQYCQEFWKVWLNEFDSEDVFFASIHGFEKDFYPGTGQLSQHPNICNIPLSSGTTQEQFRSAFISILVERLVNFMPDIIFISAGFDGHVCDIANDFFGGCSEIDYEWMTRYLIATANDFCQGRIVSILEGGYNTKAGGLSPFALSVAAHIRALHETSPSLSLSDLKQLSLPKQAILKNNFIPLANEDFCELSRSEYPKRQRRAAAVRALAHIAEKTQYKVQEESQVLPELTLDI